MAKYTEDHQVEQPARALFGELNWEITDAFDEVLGPEGTLGRETQQEVVLLPRLAAKVRAFNPQLPEDQVEEVLRFLSRDRSSMNQVRANKEVYHAMRDGVDVEYRDADGKRIQQTVRLIDWNNPFKNEFLLVSQLWIAGEYGRRRPDLVGFVNGIPVVLFELKKGGVNVREAFDNNLSDYKDTIPQLFWYNAIILLSNGADTKVGSLTAPWEYFNEWKKINDEDEPGEVSLQTAIRGICDQRRLLDILEHFILYKEDRGTPNKLLARNHQYLGVNNAIEGVKHIRENQGRLGVFWHTQGSGKSFSMVFLTQKILRSVPGDWKFVIVTDREDLDDQIYKNFASVGAVTEPEHHIRAGNKEQLMQLLKENHRYVFTLIHKFHSRDNEEFPVLSEASNIIVITDEAHRTQYDVLAMNMRKALPNAAFIGFTGTPLIKGENEKTREVFGDYVSVYDFKQSVDDGATVPLYYENRIPELELINDDLNEHLGEVLDQAMLNEKQEEQLEREFRQEYHLITRDDRLDTIAEDIVEHFTTRGYMGKGLMISIDRFTAVRMYDKVQHYWEQRISDTKAKLEHARSDLERDQLLEQLRFLQETDMAVVISSSQNEIKEFDKRDLDIRPHRKRMVNESLDEKFKDPDDPLRLVFVCAMWITGFDVPSLSTLYLDKPMKNHTLMQTIARANRVFGDKNHGLIVDYVGVFRKLQQALATYATGKSEDEGGAMPVAKKEELLHQLEQAVQQAKTFCEQRGVNLDKIIGSDGFDVVKYQDEFAKLIVGYNDLSDNVDDSVEQVLVNEVDKQHFLAKVRVVNQLYKAILPDAAAGEYMEVRAALKAIADRIKQLSPEKTQDIEEIRQQVEEVLDDSIESKGYTIDPGVEYQAIDLSKVDFDKLKEKFAGNKNKRIEAEKLKATVEKKINDMVEQNRTRMDFKERFEELIDKYNNYSINLEVKVEELFDLMKDLSEEERRHARENLSEDELAVFDLIVSEKKEELSEKEKKEIKKGVQELLQKLQAEKFVTDWKKHQQLRAQVKVAIERKMDNVLPTSYGRGEFAQACSRVFDHVVQRY